MQITSLNVPTIPAANVPMMGKAAQPAETSRPVIKVSKPEPTNNQSQGDLLERRRYESVKRSAEQARTSFAVGDQTFTIFKDTSGQFVTRFTSLRDGSVTYIPEPDMLGYLQGKRADQRAASLELNV